MVSLETNPVTEQAAATTVSERRLRAEWDLLRQLAALNPARLVQPYRGDSSLEVTLLDTPALLPGGGTRTTHRLRIEYPRFFPAVPLELYLAEPVLHPNVHPLTGFVCLWDRHRVQNTVEHALHKTVAILGWRLLNAERRHGMQPKALELVPEEMAGQLQTQPLAGIEHPADLFGWTARAARRRLS